jgi:hypothetical protein
MLINLRGDIEAGISQNTKLQGLFISRDKSKYLTTGIIYLAQINQNIKLQSNSCPWWGLQPYPYRAEKLPACRAP